MNSVQLIGRLTHDPKVDTTDKGRQVAAFRVAVNRPTGGGADFATVIAWDRLATVVGEHLCRSRLVSVEGRLQHQEWKTADGSRGSRLVVVASRVDFLDLPAAGQKRRTAGDSTDDLTQRRAG